LCRSAIFVAVLTVKLALERFHTAWIVFCLSPRAANGQEKSAARFNRQRHCEHNESSPHVSNIMTEAQRWTVKCQDPADGSGDVIVDLPPELLASLGLSVGDVLTIEVIDGAIVLTPKSSHSATP
jgi:antitoxin ChpS